MALAYHFETLFDYSSSVNMCQQCSILNMTESLLTQYASSLVIRPQPRLQILPLIAFLHKTLVQVKYFLCPSNAYCILFYSPCLCMNFQLCGNKAFLQLSLSKSFCYETLHWWGYRYFKNLFSLFSIVNFFFFFKNHICLFMCHLNPALFFKHFMITLLRSKLYLTYLEVTSIWPTFYNCSVIVTTVAEVVVVAAVIANHDVCFFCVEDSAWCIPCSAYASQ